MSINRPKSEEIVVKLRQVEVLMGKGVPRINTIRQIGVTEQTCYRLLSAACFCMRLPVTGKKTYGGMELSNS